ncbi:MAG TPA: hypothetical protein VJA26_18450 [Gammaproteobacteria bacterium]|nr:hypothetical protein [Gammaproteobacteria bacterium]
MSKAGGSYTALASIVAALVTGSIMAQTGGDATSTPSKLRSVPAEMTAAAHTDPRWKAPRTSWGHPSLEGVWSTDDLRSVPMNRPETFDTREALTSEEFLERARNDESGRDFTINVGTFLRHEFGIRTFGYSSLVIDPPNGRVPELTAAGKALAATRNTGTFGPGPFDDFQDFTLYDRCITRGVLGSILPVIYGNGLRIAQNPTSVAISYEMIHDTRIIPLDARPHIDGGIRQYMGNARGRWEGETLVVETTNFTDKTNLGVNGNGPPNSERLKLTERFTRVDPQMIEYIATIEDPVAYTAPFTLRLMITMQPNYEMYEYSCHEGNGAVAHSLSGERVFEQQVAEAVAKGLPIPERAVEHNTIRNGPDEGVRLFNINAGE